MRPSCLLHITQVVAKTASRLSWEFWAAATNVDVRERSMFELVRERKVILHALKCFLKKGGQFTPKSHDIIECVEKENDEWGHRYFALELPFLKIKSPCAAKFMCHAGNDDFWFYVRQEYHRWVYARIKGVQLIFALPALSPIVVFLLESLRVVPHRHIRQENSHVIAHFRLGAKRLCTPGLVDRMHNCKRVNQLNVCK